MYPLRTELNFRLDVEEKKDLAVAEHTGSIDLSYDFWLIQKFISNYQDQFSPGKAGATTILGAEVQYLWTEILISTCKTM